MPPGATSRMACAIAGPASKANVHVDQIVSVQKNTFMKSRPLSAGKETCTHPGRGANGLEAAGHRRLPGGPQWAEVRLAFNSFENEQVRLEWFPG